MNLNNKQKFNRFFLKDSGTKVHRQGKNQP
jgi:hypothetical protein